MGKEGTIRKCMLEMDILDALIGLGPNLFYGTGLAACVLVFRARKSQKQRGRVFIMDASKEFKKGRAQNELLPEHLERIYRWYADWRDVDGVARVVTLKEIAENDYNLNISRYVEPVIEEENMSVEEALLNLKSSLEAAYSAEDRLERLLMEAGLMP